MNKKIFTLLAGAFLMLATVGMVTAQTANSYIDDQKLELGDPVKKLVNGANPGFFHLKLDAIEGAAALTVNNLVLYMGQVQKTGVGKGTYPLFVSSLNDARANFPSAFSDGVNSPKAEESAASLWCTMVNDYYQGKNITFDFINKQQDGMALEIEATSYRKDWTWDNTEKSFSSDPTYLTPGNVSGWAFSTNYATKVDAARPLVSYVTKDSVAVICVNPTPVGTLYDVYVKVAAATAVYAGDIDDVAYFTLTEAKPFTLSAKDFNTMLGKRKNEDTSNSATLLRKLKFTGDVSDGLVNQFSQNGLWAETIDPERVVILNIMYNPGVGDLFNYTENYTSAAAVASLTGSVGNPIDPDYDFVVGKGRNLTDLGYIHLTNGKTGASNDATTANRKNYLYVQHKYYEDTPVGTRFLTFGYKTFPANEIFSTANAITQANVQTMFEDTEAGRRYKSAALLFGQSAWRLVYYPSGDSIYINPYQATYLPEQYETSSPSTNKMVHPVYGGRLTWDSLYTQASNNFTFRGYTYFGGPVDYLALDPATVSVVPPALPLTNLNGVDEFTHPFGRMVARLRQGQNPNRPTADPYEFKFYHKLYVSLQDLTSVKLLTLRTNTNTDRTHRINTHINFDIYNQCVRSETDRTTVPPDLYLIRNTIGEYLHVPLYSATDSAKWVMLEPDVHPEYLPSFQWVVIKSYPNSNLSPITLINREYPKLRFEDIMLTKDWEKPFEIEGNASGHPWFWNDKDVTEKIVAFGQHNTTANRKATFIRLSGAAKNNANLGYTFFNPDTVKVNLYAFKYMSRIAETWINIPNFDYWDYPRTDTTIYVIARNEFDKMYFQIDSSLKTAKTFLNYGYVNEPTGHGNHIPNLVQLRRQAYSLTYRDPFKYICEHELTLRNDFNRQYAIGKVNKTNLYYDIFGVPTFHLRHYYYFPSAGEAALTGYNQNNAAFALVQQVNIVPASGQNAADLKAKFLEYLKDVYGKAAADEMNIYLSNPNVTEDSYRLGFFVAAVDDQMRTLKAAIRADAATRVSTFMLEKFDDPLYRRFNVAQYDGGADKSDAPRVLRFHNMDNQGYYELFENTGQWPSQRNYWENVGKKNYLGIVNTAQYRNAETAIYVDTAYVNRGTGHIKPQYMLVVRPQLFGDVNEKTEDCIFFGETSTTTKKTLDGYLRGMYLINATDSAKISNGVKNEGRVDNSATRADGLRGGDYIWDTKWERLVFTDAVHWNDTLYILDGADLTGLYGAKVGGRDMLDMKKVEAAAIAKNSKIRKIKLNDNLHKDVVFSMRLIERGANDFIIESETGGPAATDGRIFGATSINNKNSTGPMIAPCEGGWIKIQNGVPVISRSDEVHRIPQSMRFNVRKVSLDMEDAVANEVVAPVAVIGNDGFVTILNAAGKKVVITNVLGQNVANAVLPSDNATIAAPKGVVIVAVEGEAAVKAVVK